MMIKTRWMRKTRHCKSTGVLLFMRGCVVVSLGKMGGTVRDVCVCRNEKKQNRAKKLLFAHAAAGGHAAARVMATSSPATTLSAGGGATAGAGVVAFSGVTPPPPQLRRPTLANARRSRRPHALHRVAPFSRDLRHMGVVEVEHVAQRGGGPATRPPPRPPPPGTKPGGGWCSQYHSGAAAPGERRGWSALRRWVRLCGCVRKGR